MKKYSSKQAKKGKTAFRTPSVQRYLMVVRNTKRRARFFSKTQSY